MISVPVFVILPVSNEKFSKVSVPLLVSVESV